MGSTLSTPAPSDKPKSNTGFSLVELSIVLVILGLLAGGVIAGQSLIRAAELRSVTADMQRYQTVFLTFRDKYFALPGDMLNAVKFWGAAAGGTTDGMDGTCALLGIPSTDKATCNGDGNGQISDINYSNNGYEVFRAWQQLANAGLIEGSFSGIRSGTIGAAPGLFSPTPGVNIPKSKLGKTGYRIHYIGNYGDGNFWPSNYGNAMDFFNPLTHTAELRPAEAWNIDTKLDDSKPSFGSIMSWRYTAGGITPGCTTSDTQSSTEYAVSTTDKLCVIMLKLGV